MARKPFDPDRIPDRDGPGEEIDALTWRVNGAAIEVHRTLGPGYPESVYSRALRHELDMQGIAYDWEHPIDVVYKGKKVGRGKVDMLVENKLVLELKATEKNWPKHTAQALAYLKATKLRLALVINFDVAVLKDGIKRLVL